jgi:ATP-dependent exoDNAse (exonuclease V) alpha subunit
LIKNYRQGAGSGLPNIADKVIGRESKGSGLSRIYGGWDHALNVPTQKKKDFATSIDNIFGGSEDCEVFGYSRNHDEEQIFQDMANKVIELRDSCNLFVDCVVLTAKRVEVANLNAKLQAAFMPDLEQTLETFENVSHYYEGVKFTFVNGDRVMHLENDYTQDMFNGDVGMVTNVDRNQRKLQIRLPDTVDLKNASIDDVQPAYSCTCHKSQGSEYKIVMIYISNAAQMLHVDQWLYTAFTRARQKVYIYGYTDEIVATVRREMKHRRTFLKHRLQLDFSHHLNDLVKDELQDTPQ